MEKQLEVSKGCFDAFSPVLLEIDEKNHVFPMW